MEFPISRDPPEGGTGSRASEDRFSRNRVFPISRDPPEGGTTLQVKDTFTYPFTSFPISRDPPEGGTLSEKPREPINSDVSNF